VEIVVILEPALAEFVLSMIPPSLSLGPELEQLPEPPKNELVYKAESPPPTTLCLA